MRRIKAMQELEELIAVHTAKGYIVRLNYRLIPSKQARYGEDGLVASTQNQGEAPKNPLEWEDLRSRTDTWITIAAIHYQD